MCLPGRAKDQVAFLAKKKSQLIKGGIFLSIGEEKNGFYYLGDLTLYTCVVGIVRWIIAMLGEMSLRRFKQLQEMTNVKGYKCFISGRAEEQ